MCTIHLPLFYFLGQNFFCDKKQQCLLNNVKHRLNAIYRVTWTLFNFLHLKSEQ